MSMFRGSARSCRVWRPKRSYHSLWTDWIFYQQTKFCIFRPLIPPAYTISCCSSTSQSGWYTHSATSDYTYTYSHPVFVWMRHSLSDFPILNLSCCERSGSTRGQFRSYLLTRWGFRGRVASIWGWWGISGVRKVWRSFVWFVGGDKFWSYSTNSAPSETSSTLSTRARDCLSASSQSLFRRRTRKLVKTYQNCRSRFTLVCSPLRLITMPMFRSFPGTFPGLLFGRRRASSGNPPWNKSMGWLWV